MQVIQKLLDITRDKKDIKKRGKNTKNIKRSNNTNNKYFFTFIFLYRKIYIFLENTFGKT